MNMKHLWNEPDSGRTKYLVKTCPNDPSSTINPLWTGLVLNLEIQNERAVTDSLTVVVVVVVIVVVVDDDDDDDADDDSEEEKKRKGRRALSEM